MARDTKLRTERAREALAADMFGWASVVALIAYLTETHVAGLICFGYPLCGAGDRAKLRGQVLLDLRTPILFIQGTRDKLCPLDLFDQAREKMSAPSVLHVVTGGDHSLVVSKTELKAQGVTQAEVDCSIGAAIASFLRTLPRTET